MNKKAFDSQVERRRAGLAWLLAACLPCGAVAVAQEVATTAAPPQKMIVALTRIAKPAAGKAAAAAPAKKQSITVNGPTAVTLVSMSMFGAGTRVTQDANGQPVMSSAAELGLAITDSSGEYRIEADARTKISPALIEPSFTMAKDGRMVLYIEPGVVLRVTGWLRERSIEATSIAPGEPVVSEGAGAPAKP